MLDGMTKGFTMLHKESLASSDPIFLISPEYWWQIQTETKRNHFSAGSLVMSCLSWITLLKLNHSLQWGLRWLEIKINLQQSAITYIYRHWKSWELAKPHNNAEFKPTNISLKLRLRFKASWLTENLIELVFCNALEARSKGLKPTPCANTPGSVAHKSYTSSFVQEGKCTRHARTRR